MSETALLVLRVALAMVGVAVALSLLRRRADPHHRQKGPTIVPGSGGTPRIVTTTAPQPAELAARWERIRVIAVRTALGFFALVVISVVIGAPVDLTTLLVIGVGASIVAYWIASLLSGWYEGKASMKK